VEFRHLNFGFDGRKKLNKLKSGEKFDNLWKFSLYIIEIGKKNNRVLAMVENRTQHPQE
jgi:hypothetical protein